MNTLDTLNPCNDFALISSERGFVAFMTHPLSVGEFQRHQYTLSLRIFAEDHDFSPQMILKIRDDNPDALSQRVRFILNEGELSREVSTCQAEPVFSILQGDYVSIFRFSIEEKDFLKLYNKNNSFSFSSPDYVCQVKLYSDDSLSYVLLKERLAPNLLTAEQKKVLELHRQKEQNERRLAEEEAKRLKAEQEKLEMMRQEQEAREREKKKAELEELERKQKEKEQILSTWKEQQKRNCCILLSQSLIDYMPNHLEKELRFDDDQCRIYDGVVEDLFTKVVNQLDYSNEDYPDEKNQIINSDVFRKDVICQLERSKILFKTDSLFHTVLPHNDYIISRDLTKQLAIELIDGGKTLEQVKLLLLVRSYLRRAVLVHKEYRVYHYNSAIYHTYEREKTLIEKGLISISKYGDMDKDFNSKHYGEKYCFLHITDYQTACDILDGKIDMALRKETKGCYIATAIYGSYDCPEVWTLRRFRDYNLDATWYGRIFIKTYYAISPTLVRWFGGTNWFQSFWRHHLDRLVQKLQNAGFENTPYQD